MIRCSIDTEFLPQALRSLGLIGHQYNPNAMWFVAETSMIIFAINVPLYWKI